MKKIKLTSEESAAKQKLEAYKIEFLRKLNATTSVTEVLTLLDTVQVECRKEIDEENLQTEDWKLHAEIEDYKQIHDRAMEEIENHGPTTLFERLADEMSDYLDRWESNRQAAIEYHPRLKNLYAGRDAVNNFSKKYGKLK